MKGEKNVQKQSRCATICDKMLVIDQFGEGYQMKLDKEGNDIKRSVIGALLSLILLATILTYLFQKLEVMMGRKGV